MDSADGFFVAEDDECFSEWKLDTVSDKGPEAIIRNTSNEIIRFLLDDDIGTYPYPDGKDTDSNYNYGRPIRFKFSGIIIYPDKLISKKIRGFYYFSNHCGRYRVME